MQVAVVTVIRHHSVDIVLLVADTVETVGNNTQVV